MRQKQIPGCWCPLCRAWLDMATTDGNCAPQPGFFSVCFECGEILLFDEELVLRKPTVAEFRALQRSNEWLKIQFWARRIAKRRKEKGPARLGRGH